MKKPLLITLLTCVCATATAADIHHRFENRSITTAERAEWMEAQAEEAENAKLEEGGQQVEASTYYSGFDLYTSHEGAMHHVVAITPNGNEITLVDGSTWRVRSSDCYRVLNWLTTDEILITPNSSFFSLYDYKMINRSTGAEVKANLLLQPVLGAADTYQITGFNDNYDYIYLNDGSVWAISPYDHALYNKWMIGDLIIVGSNSGWDRHSRPNVLINATYNSYIRTICIQ